MGRCDALWSELMSSMCSETEGGKADALCVTGLVVDTGRKGTLTDAGVSAKELTCSFLDVPEDALGTDLNQIHPC